MFGTVVVFALQKIVNMKKRIFVLPLCVFLTFCSSSRKAVTPVAPGISNVNVSRNDTMTSAAKASASFTAADRDFAYKATRDTTLNGTWTLDGMMGSNGSWSDTQSWNKDTSATSRDTAMTVSSDANVMGATSTSASNTTSSATTGRRSKGKNKINRRALYDSAQARLNMNYKDSSVLDTTVQPFKYWTRIPTVTINATRQIFTGNTGCNSMSGSLNFSEKDIRFSRNIVTSKMSCNEYDETNFLTALKKADNYTVNGNTLELRQGTTKLLTFRKS